MSSHNVSASDLNRAFDEFMHGDRSDAIVFASLIPTAAQDELIERCAAALETCRAQGAQPDILKDMAAGLSIMEGCRGSASFAQAIAR